MFPIGQSHNQTPHFLFQTCMTDVCLEYVMHTKAMLTHSLDNTNKSWVLGNLNNHIMLLSMILPQTKQCSVLSDKVQLYWINGIT